MTRPLDELRFVARADVYKAGIPAARLERRPDSVVLRYLPEYLASGGKPLATTLPISSEPVRTHAPGALPPYFSGLLPEGRRIVGLRQAVKTSADDEFSLLLAVGADGIGDVAVLPEGEPVVETQPRLVVDAWSETRFASLYAAATGRSDIDRVALPGVQEKVSARVISLPVATAGARYLLKLDPPEYPHIVANEAFFLGAARASGLMVPETLVVHDIDGNPGLLVRRFDRTSTRDGAVRLLAQEDGCQVLGRYPADKYNLEAEEVAAALVGVTRARPVAARTLLTQFVFAYLTCNGDAHAKNFSVGQDPGGEWRITPAYDLPTTHPYGDHTVALRIQGRSREDIGRADFLSLAAHLGLRERAATKAIDQIIERSPLWTERLDELPFDDHQIHRLRRAIAYRHARLRASS